ncbi:hypothetical protein SADO_13473 [Salinisphaera dokdonensis CL-ES53]|uniref:Uncharacterized protein n=1 Tax=Salinisphaera dokdonensis CL-ES53 TaxID=1304272 RepID=A0ABV2B318_9GAMM
MSAVLETIDEPTFFAPANDDAVDVLIGQYDDAFPGVLINMLIPMVLASE